MEYVILPHDEVAQLHLLVNMQLTPLTPVPGLFDAQYIIAPDQSSFAFIDQSNKRIGFYRILSEAPYYETLISPSTLPRNCRADCLLIYQGALFIGGASRLGECLWKRKPGDNFWTSVSLPPQISANRHKSIDALFMQDNMLIAVDNVIFPKWILTYDIADYESIVFLDMYTLPQHVSHEQVIFGADNEKYIALVSIGFPVGEGHYFLSLFNKHTLEELWHWFVPVIQSKYENYRYCFDENSKYQLRNL